MLPGLHGLAFDDVPRGQAYSWSDAKFAPAQSHQGSPDPNDDHKITAAEVISKTVGAAQGSVTSSNVCVLGISPNGVCATGSSTFTNGQPITISVTTPFTTITPFIHVKSLTGSAFGKTLPS